MQGLSANRCGVWRGVAFVCVLGRMVWCMWSVCVVGWGVVYVGCMCAWLDGVYVGCMCSLGWCGCVCVCASARLVGWGVVCMWFVCVERKDSEGRLLLGSPDN